MSVNQLRSQSFPTKALEDWHSKAEESLKGKTVEALTSNTYEQINLKPLYSREDERLVSEYPSGSDFRRGLNALGYYSNDWKVAQKISYQTVEELNNKIQEAFEKGQTAISFEVTKDLFQEKSNFFTTIKELSSRHPFALNTKEYQALFISTLEKLAIEEEVSGYAANDPVSLFVETGVIVEDYLSDWGSCINRAGQLFPNLKTVLVDTTPYHNGGANAVQELGIAMATGVYYLDHLLSLNMTVKEALSKMIFQFSIGSNFFMEIAKLRAARVLWDRIAEIYGAEEKDRGMHITTETSRFTKTVHDPHVNLLRASNEAFAAVLGGVQYLQVDSFNSLTGSSPFSERVARNSQWLLKEEAHLQKVVDPAGGSWYIEDLTNQLAEKAWTFFQKIDANGGIVESLKTDWLQQQISQVFQDKIKDVESRKQSIIGTNVYANLEEEVPVVMPKKRSLALEAGIPINSIPQRRLSEPFEDLRTQAQQIKNQNGIGPFVTMLCLGNLKQYKQRFDFMRGFLAAGGINVAESKPLYSVKDALEWVDKNSGSYYCFCGSNEQYETLGHDILQALKRQNTKAQFYLAGLPDKELQNRWLEEGIQQFIHMKSNCYETLSTILSDMEVKTVE